MSPLFENKYRRRRLYIAVALLVTSASLAIRPAWHAIKRESARQNAWVFWQDWKTIDARNPTHGNPAFWLNIPKASIDSLVVYGTTSESLNLYPGIDRYLGINENRVPAVLAHRDTHFRKLHKLSIGDSVHMENSDGYQSQLRISRKQIVDTADAERIAQQLASDCGDESLVMVTCYPPQYIGPAPKRLLVLATPIQSAREAVKKQPHFATSLQSLQPGH